MDIREYSVASNVTPSGEVVMRASRARIVRLLLLALAFTAGGVWIITTGDSSGWIVLLFFGACAVILGAMLRRPGTLTLRAESFTYANLWKAKTIAWSDVAEFGLMPLRETRVGIKFTGDSTSAWRKANEALTGFDRGLPDNYGVSAQELLNLLERWRAAAMTPHG